MNFHLALNRVLSSNATRYLLLSATGLLIIFVFSIIQHVPSPTRGEYYYSTLIGRNFTGAAKIVFIIIALIAGYIWNLNPWLGGISLFLIFPVTAIIEASVYPGSHNLIPFELMVYFMYALPSILAMYLGKFIFKQVSMHKAKSLSED